MALSFPSNPDANATYSAPNGLIYTYDGVKWVGPLSSATIPIATTTTLGGIKVGSGLNITAAGVLSTTAPVAVTPVANFTTSATSGVAPLAVTFTDTSTNGPTSWSWSFGDGGTSTTQNSSHTYASAGTYTITHTATNSAGTSAAVTKTVTVSAAVVTPVASFTASATSGVGSLAVQFTDTSTNGPTSWSWNFGDGGTSTAQSPIYTYTTPGTYTVTLTATNSAGSDAETITNLITLESATFNYSYSGFSTSAYDTNFNLRASAIAAGWNQAKPLNATITIPAGAVLGSTSPGISGTPAFSTGTSFPAGSTLSLIIASGGYIVGAGGSGALGSDGTDGGPACYFDSSIATSITNNGVIGGGGGGGGAGARGDRDGTWMGNLDWNGGPGGGGAGYLGGALAVHYQYTRPYVPSGKKINNDGQPGTVTTGGGGGAYGSDGTYGENRYGSPGGDGGDLGQPGEYGGNWIYRPDTVAAWQPHANGIAGAAIHPSSRNFTFSVQGTVLGSISTSISVPTALAVHGTGGDAPLIVAFTDQSTGSPVGWSWDFGDPSSVAVWESGANTSGRQNPNHVYSNAGTFYPTLTVRNVAGVSTSYSLSPITVTTAVSPPFSGPA